MEEYREHDPKRVESLRMQIDSLIQNYLNQKPIPGIADFAEVFGAESYVVEMRRQKAIKIDIKSFREEMVTRLLEQSESSGTNVVLPKVFEMLPQTILPPDEGEIKTGSGEGVEKKKYIPRTQYLIELLSEMGEQYEIIGGKNTSDMMRERTYFIFHLPNSEKAIFVNNEEGNTTFIIYQINSKQEAIDLAALTKDEIRAKELHSHSFVQVDWTGDEESWKGKLFKCLTGSPQEIIETNSEEGLTLFGLSKELGITRQSAQFYVDKILLNHPELKPKEGVGLNKRNVLHYSRKLVDKIKEIKNQEEIAPEDWVTIKFISEKIGRSDVWIVSRMPVILENHPEWKPKKKRIAGQTRAGLHYPPKIILELEKLAKIFEKAPDGWLPFERISKELHKSKSWVKSHVTKILAIHPEWKSEFFLSIFDSRVLQHYPPELVAELKKKLENEVK